jgi:gag-polyprotein putative aspartyl protease
LSLIVTLTADDLLRNGPILKIEIGNPSDPSRVARVNALVDTGAAFTAMNPRLAHNCGLIQRGEKKIHVPGNTGPEDAKAYPEFAASLRFQDLIYSALEFMESSLVQFLRPNFLA